MDIIYNILSYLVITNINCAAGEADWFVSIHNLYVRIKKMRNVGEVLIV